VRLVSVWDDHQVTTGIWKAVQDDESQLAPLDDQIFDAIVLCQRPAENTFFFILIALYIIHTPG
jgi:hypothetical protein